MRNVANVAEDMVSRCLKQAGGFGVLLIRDGTEAGRADTFDIGTVAEIVDWYQGSDGLLGVTVEGRDRFKLESVEQQADGLYVGDVSRLDAEPSTPLPEEYQFLSRLLKDVLDELGSHYQSISKQYADATWVGYRLAEILPLPLTTKQSFLEMNDPIDRLEQLKPYVKEEAG